MECKNSNIKLSECPCCGSMAFVQWFNDEDCFAACIKGADYGPDDCPLAEAQNTKWTIFDNERDAALHWNEICRKVRAGEICPECQSTLMEELEKGYFHCCKCHTITHKGKLLTKDKAEELLTKYEIDVMPTNSRCIEGYV